MDAKALETALEASPAPRVTRELLESRIVSTQYHRLTDTLTLAVLTLVNGFTVTGESACASPENYNQEIGEKIAFDNAFDKLWALEGYVLKYRLMWAADAAVDVRAAGLDAELRPGEPFLTPRDVASICHEANRRLCFIGGDRSQAEWRDAPEWQRDSAVAGVMFHVEHPDATASASHDAWMADKLAAGWVLGSVKDPDASPPTHPCLVAFDELPPEQQAKDHLFKGIAHGLRSFLLLPRTLDDAIA